MRRVFAALAGASLPKKAALCALAGSGALATANALFHAPYRTPGLPSTANLDSFAPTMNRREALAILNLGGSPSRAEIQKSHRNLMALHHPDKGGSSFIATKVNEARDYLTLGGPE